MNMTPFSTKVPFMDKVSRIRHDTNAAVGGIRMGVDLIRSASENGDIEAVERIAAEILKRCDAVRTNFQRLEALVSNTEPHTAAKSGQSQQNEIYDNIDGAT